MDAVLVLLCSFQVSHDRLLAIVRARSPIG
jgi:hypothetical protein